MSRRILKPLQEKTDRTIPSRAVMIAASIDKNVKTEKNSNQYDQRNIFETATAIHDNTIPYLLSPCLPVPFQYRNQQILQIYQKDAIDYGSFLRGATRIAFMVIDKIKNTVI
jgi:hypothetical protein